MGKKPDEVLIFDFSGIWLWFYAVMMINPHSKPKACKTYSCKGMEAAKIYPLCYGSLILKKQGECSLSSEY